MSTVASHRRGLGKLGVLVGLSLSGFFLALAIWPSERSPVPRALEISSASRDSSSAFKPIEKLRVGDRVLTGLASDNLCETSVDERTWKKVTITAVGIWPDGTIDKHSIVTLQPPEWLIANDARVGAEVPLPLDLIEMGGPTDLRGRVDSIEPCPPISRKPGRVVLTTVNHLNNACRELTLRDSQGNVDTIKTTDWHPFWSESRQDWVKAAHLHDGELLQGKAGEPLTLIGSNRIQGVHTVFNMTVEEVHVYRVGRFACFVHNNDCYRVIGDAELPSAIDGNWSDRPGTFPDDPGHKWVWPNKEAAEKWKGFLESNGETGNSIVKIPIPNPILSYPGFRHPPEGTAFLIPIKDLGKGTVVD